MNRIWTSLTTPNRVRRRLLAIGLLVLTTSQPLSAAPVFGKKLTLRQPDGQTVQVRVWGDEFYRVVESLDGYALTRDPATKAICYARASGDKRTLISTGVRPGTGKPRALGLTKHLRISPQAVISQVTKAKAAYAPGIVDDGVQVAAGGEPVPPPTSNGNIQGICLLVDFPDEAGSIPPSTVSSFCNQTGFSGFGNNGSVRDYFYDVSKGHLTYTNHVPQQYYTAAYPKAYYDDPLIEYGLRARQLITEAINSLDASGFDFSQYDADHDGKIDAINCLYAGTTTSAWASGLWPHCGYLAYSIDGVTTFRYQITDMGDDLHLDTFCHENGHMLCNWPDLYDYGYESHGVGRYCLMSDMGSETNPVEPCAFLKYVAGWTTTTLLATHQSGLQLPAGQNQIYKYEHPAKTSEYFLIENRQQAGRDLSLPDSGLALWHIDTTGSNDFEQRLPVAHYMATLVQADGRWDLESYPGNSGDSTDLWKSPTYVTCGVGTTPNTNWWDGSCSSLGISQVSVSGPTMSFAFGSSAIIVSPTTFHTVVLPGTPAPVESFTLTNPSTIVPLNYTVDCQGWWVHAEPYSGTSLGETQTIDVVYDNDFIPYWPPGDYSTILMVNAPGAENNPQTVVLWLTIGSVGPDFDHDTDVDQVDFGYLQGCLSGVSIPQSRPECADADLDNDEDVDRYDLQILTGCMSGAETPADTSCDK